MRYTRWFWYEVQCALLVLWGTPYRRRYNFKLSNGVMSKLLSILSLAILSGCASQPLDDVEIAKVEVVEDVLFYEGELNEESINIALDKAQGHQIKRININSPGGEVTSSMMFANWIRSNGIDVEVNEMCFSSCANYVFPAGVNKYVSEKDFIGWHGSAHQKYEKLPDPDAEKSFQKYIAKARVMETKFYKSLGVNSKLPIMGQVDGYSCQVHDEWGWYYSVSDLKKLGVDNIVLTDGHWDPSHYHSKKLCQLILPEKV